MSASQGPRSRAGVPERVARRPATAERFATSVPPQTPGDPNPHFDRDSTEVMPLRIERQPEIADGGEERPAAGAPAAEGGADSSATSSLLAAMALHRFDDDARWRKLARTGRAL